jgi:hypothetical protein
MLLLTEVSVSKHQAMKQVRVDDGLRLKKHNKKANTRSKTDPNSYSLLLENLIEVFMVEVSQF